jgi:hypothetical protein
VKEEAGAEVPPPPPLRFPVVVPFEKPPLACYRERCRTAVRGAHYVMDRLVFQGVLAEGRGAPGERGAGSIPHVGTWVNKGEKEGRSSYAPAPSCAVIC